MSFCLANFTYLDNGPYSLTIEKGECCGLIGPSGIGKSQLCRAVTELILSEGKVMLDGEIREHFSGPDWRRQVTYLPAESFWWFDFAGEHFSDGIDCNMLYRQCEQLGLDREIVNWKVERLSTGERQRLALLRRVVGKPQVLLLDEPTSSLGEEHVRCVEEFVRGYQLSQGASVLWISHDPAQLTRVAQVCYNMTKRALVRQTPKTKEASRG